MFPHKHRVSHPKIANESVNLSSGKFPVDSYTKQLYNDLPVAAVRKFIEKDKTPAIPL